MYQGLDGAPYATEANVHNTVDVRRSSDQTLFFVEGYKPLPPYAALGKSTPDDGGARMASPEGYWRGGSSTALSRTPLLDRASLNAQSVHYVTFYARVSSDAIAKHALSVKGGVGVYGAEACAQDAPPFDCDPASWWPDDTVPRTCMLGRDPAAPSKCMPYGVRVGQEYNLRDVDCYDESVDALRDFGVSWGTLTDSACERPALPP